MKKQNPTEEFATRKQLKETEQRLSRQIEDLAVSTANEFAELRNEVATKAEMRELGKTLGRAIENIDIHLSSIASKGSS